MSVDLYVFIRDSQLPSRNEWQKACEQSGVDLVFDDFDSRRHTGFLPVKMKGQGTGFEYYFGPAEKGLTEGVPIGDRDSAVTFILHSDMTELKAAMLAAAVLTKQADGVFFEPQGGEHAIGDQVFEMIRKDEAAEQDRLKRRAWKDAGITDRRCPQCGAPFPTYRNTCKACGFQIEKSG